MKPTCFFILCIFLFCRFACKNSSGDSKEQTASALANDFDSEVEQGLSDTTSMTTTEPPADPVQPPPSQPKSQPEKPAPPIPRQIIKTANYRIQVKNVNESTRHAHQLATKHGGFVSASELVNSSYEITNSITIRVPAFHFDSLLEDLGEEAIFTQFKRISSQDVTAEYVDITTRLKTKKEVRDRYVDILRNKAKSVKDVLEAEDKIRVIQEEIEAQEGRLRYLKDQVALSTIQLEIYQVIEYQPEPAAFRESFWTKLFGALKGGWDLLQGIVLFFVNIWPLVILGALIWWRRQWIWRKIRRRQA